MTFSGKQVIISNVAGKVSAEFNVRLAQLDRAFGYGPKGRGFESSNARCCVHWYTPVENSGSLNN